MSYMPGNKVAHVTHGTGTVIRLSHSHDPLTGDALGDEVVTVRFNDGEGDYYVAFAGPAIDTLVPFRTSDEHCPKCKVSLQGKPIPEADQHLYGATHYSNKIALYDDGFDMTVAYQCFSCLAMWDRFTGKSLKRLTPYWGKAGSTHPQPIHTFGPVHVYNIRAYRRKYRHDVYSPMDRALTREIKRRWYLYPFVRLIAPIARRHYDRKLGIR